MNLYCSCSQWLNLNDTESKKKKKNQYKEDGIYTSVQCFMWILYVNRNKATARRINFTH